ncbi:protein phosphatase 2C domain-containing protein [Ectobacillus polymachus]|uniref:protein phosphatase 2C domain-containing protein n=1 Tax=Ectobacillus polymachus TaxID=1508806 RepID=UPI003A85F1CD
MNVQYFQRKSPNKKECEDAFVRNDRIGLYGVCDGATPLVPFEDEEGHNGAYLAAHTFKSYMESLMKDEGIVESMVKANQLLAGKMMTYNINQTKKHHLWSTCFAGVHFTNTEIQYGQLGDCMVVAKFLDNRINVLTKDTVKGINLRAKKKREKDSLEVDDSIRKRLIYNRSMANTQDGYSVANGMDNVRMFIQRGTIDRSDVQALFLCTDGLFHPTKSLEQVASFVWEQGIEKYVAELEAIEIQRGIHADDKTALIWMR